VLTRLDFRRTFWLDVDWSPKGVGGILSQKEGRFEKVVAYASKSLTEAQKKFHPMEGECYMLIWGIMHFRQYLHKNHFILRTDHKPLKWLATVSDANGRRGRWVDMLQDFSFKIIHRPGLRHTNVDALSRNPVGPVVDDDDFSEEIQDIASIRTDASKGDEEFLCVRTGKEKEWLGIRRGDKELVQHRACCFEINHYRYDGSHQLYVVNVVSGEEQPEEVVSGEAEATVGGKPVQDDGERIVVKRRRPQYFDKRQQLDLILEAKELVEFRDQELSPTEFDEEEDQEMDAKCIDIWEDAVCLGLLKNGALPDSVDLEKNKRARKRVSNYYWKEQRLYFKGLLVPKPEERMSLVSQMHEDLGHFREQRTLVEICRRYFWHHRTEDVKVVVRSCQQCQLMRSKGSIHSGDEQLKNIPICDLFHRVALDIAGPLPETKSGNRYILVAIDHYSKWCKAKAVADHSAKTASRFLEDDIICRYGVPRFIPTDNGGEWATKFEMMCKDYEIQHQRTALQWP